ncbi:MAG TPA: hypothetical protein VN611_04925 [Patescibacteria group bacterium]|nr:hypothetical protein [Patescibacteria group bacterium]
MGNLNEIVPGLSAIVQKNVEKSDAALNYGNGALGNLLATPRYVEWLIKAAIKAVDSHLPEGMTTVGRYMEFTHEAPTAVGMSITIKATLAAVNESCLSFDIVATDELGQVGHGRHERVIIRLDQFAKKLEDRFKPIRQIPFK